MERTNKEIKERTDAEKVNKILTPGDRIITHEFNTPDGKTFFVVEVSGCKFEGFQVCLSTQELLRIPRMHAMKKKMRSFWDRLASKPSTGNIIGGG